MVYGFQAIHPEKPPNQMPISILAKRAQIAKK
jgi:hypothetical protein